MWTVVKEIVREDGVRGLFRGLTSTWAREIPGYFLLFGGYHFSRQLLTPHGQDCNDLSKKEPIVDVYYSTYIINIGNVVYYLL